MHLRLTRFSFVTVRSVPVLLYYRSSRLRSAHVRSFRLRFAYDRSPTSALFHSLVSFHVDMFVSFPRCFRMYLVRFVVVVFVPFSHGFSSVFRSRSATVRLFRECFAIVRSLHFRHAFACSFSVRRCVRSFHFRLCINSIRSVIVLYPFR